jgi:hypothetical protein
LQHGTRRKIEKIKKRRAKLVREEALQFYNAALEEVREFNDGWRRHVMHSRAKTYHPERAIALWGHVYRFMDRLAERMSQSERTSALWKAQTR